jgi:N-acetyl-anhydromuramyl-L-alanine amidase AmpD
MAFKIINLIGHLYRHPSLHYAGRTEESVKRIVIHHSGTKTGDPQSFAQFHVKHCGWPGIAYHYVISKAGTIWKCNIIQSITYHAKGANADSIGICLVGDFTKDDPTGAQIYALRYLVDEINKGFGKRKLAVVLHKNIKGSKTTCPGKNFPENWRTL